MVNLQSQTLFLSLSRARVLHSNPTLSILRNFSYSCWFDDFKTKYVNFVRVKRRILPGTGLATTGLFADVLSLLSRGREADVEPGRFGRKAGEPVCDGAPGRRGPAGWLAAGLGAAARGGGGRGVLIWLIWSEQWRWIKFIQCTSESFRHYNHLVLWRRLIKENTDVVRLHW